jgi:hypothetical protein
LRTCLRGDAVNHNYNYFSILTKNWNFRLLLLPTYGTIASLHLWTWCMDCSSIAVFEYSTMFSRTLWQVEVWSECRHRSMLYLPYRYMHIYSIFGLFYGSFYSLDVFLSIYTKWI